MKKPREVPAAAGASPSGTLRPTFRPASENLASSLCVSNPCSWYFCGNRICDGSGTFRGREVTMKRLAMLFPMVLACSSSAFRLSSSLDGGSSAIGGNGGDTLGLPAPGGGSTATGGGVGTGKASMASDGSVTIPGVFVAVSAGYGSACGLRADGSISCWEFAALDQPMSYPGKFSSFTAGGGVCGLKADGTIVCWGDTVAGEDTPPPGTYSYVTTAGWYGCAVRKTDGRIVCWGEGLSPAPVQGDTFISIDASPSDGNDFACGVKTDSTLACWGDAIPLGPGTPPAGTFTEVSAGNGYGCAVRTDGAVTCWGGNVDADLSYPPASSSTPAGQTETFSSVSTSNGWACALRKIDGTVVCWGVHTGEYAPLASVPSGSFKFISVSTHDTCGVRTDGTIVCWANPVRQSQVGY